MREIGRSASDKLRQAIALYSAGRSLEAETTCRAILDSDANEFKAWHLLGLIAHRSGRSGQAIRLMGRALAISPLYFDALLDRGTVFCALGSPQEALADYERALTIHPEHPTALYNRGFALQLLERHEQALVCYERALRIRPDFPEALNNRGNVLYALNRPDEALASFSRAMTIKPNYAEAFNNRGTILFELGSSLEALENYNRAIAIEPRYVEALSNRGSALFALNRVEEALESCDAALSIRPNYVQALYNKGNILRELTRSRAAIETYEQALAVTPNHGPAQLGACMAELPILYTREAEIATRRSAYEQRLHKLCRDLETGQIQGDLAAAIGRQQPFYLAYQGYNDRDLQAKYGSLVRRVMAKRYPAIPLSPPPAPTEPVRVGIVTGYFNLHTIWKLFGRGWLTQFDRERFRIFAYHTGSKQDEETKIAAANSDRFINGPLSIQEWRRVIAEDAPHVLIYPEIGMDRVCPQLAAQRLAPIQCVSWGHPETSGFPTIDYFLSSDLMEPPDADDHYTEKLIRLPNLSIYYEPLHVERIFMTREELNIRSTAVVYWCGQSLFKYLPQYDVVFPSIARQIADCQFIFFKYGKSASITELFQHRLQQAFAAVGLKMEDYCIFLPRIDLQRFTAVFSLCNVVLDSIGWSGGNTTLESLSHNLPIVTMSAPLMRGRHTMAILNMIGVRDTITHTVEEYVSTAVRLAQDADWRMALQERISQYKSRVYRDKVCILEFQEFLNRAARGGISL